MFEGQRRGLLFLLAPADPAVEALLPQLFEALPELTPATLDPTSIEQAILAGRDTLAVCAAREGARWRKYYPDNVRFLYREDDHTQAPGGYVDYALAAPGLFEQVKAIVLAERSRRRVLNTQSADRLRHSFDYTATAYVLSADYTRMLMIHKADGRWFPPGGHIEEGEYPHEAVVREVREETGYTIRFIQQPDGVGKQLGEAAILPVPYQVLLEDITTHYHHDFIYLCQVEGERAEDAEFEGQWIELAQVLALPAPDDIHYTIEQLVRYATSQT